MVGKLSIIIPVYNTPVPKLQRCFDSIRRITLKNYECLVVDDGSEKAVGSYIRRYCEEDPAFRYFRKENDGVSSARNLGIKNADGEYLYFVDSDDEIVPGVFDKFLLENHNEDLILSDYILESNGKMALVNVIKTVENNYESIIREVLTSVHLNSSCCKFIRKNFIDQNNIRFDTALISAEDVAFVLDILIQKPSFSYLNEVSYIYHFQPSTVAGRIRQLSIQGLDYQTEILGRKETLIQLGNFTQDERKTLTSQTLESFIHDLFSIVLCMTEYGIYTQKIDNSIKEQITAVNLNETNMMTKIKGGILLSNGRVVRRTLAGLRKVVLMLRGRR